MNKNKYTWILLFTILICKNVYSQKVNVNWTDFYKNNKGTIQNTWAELDEKFYFFIDESKFDHKPMFKMARFDKNLQLEKAVLLPSRFNGEKIIDYRFSKSENDIIISAKYYEKTGTNRYVLLKAIVDKDLTNTINFEKVTDIETQSTFVKDYVMHTTYLKNNKVMIKTSPREGVKDKNIFKFDIYDDKLIKKEWSAEVDLTELLKDFEMISSRFSENREYIFLLRTKLKFMKKTKDEYIFGKFTKEKGIEVKQFNFGDDKFSTDVDLLIDENRNVAYIRNTFSSINSKNKEISIRKFDISNLNEIYSRNIDFGSTAQKCFKGTLGLLWPSYSFDDFTLKNVIINQTNGQLSLVAELISPFKSEVRDGKEFKENGANGNIIVVNIDSIGNYLIQVIPHEVKTTSPSQNYSTFYYSKFQDKACFLMYDSDKNAANNLCSETTKTDYIKDNDDNELYMVLIDKNNKVEKIKPEKSFQGDGKYVKKYKNFELNNIRKISDNRYLVKNDYLFGILTIE